MADGAAATAAVTTTRRRLLVVVGLVAVLSAAVVGGLVAAAAPGRIQLSASTELPDRLVDIDAPGRWKQTTLEDAVRAGVEADGRRVAVAATLVDGGSAIRLTASAEATGDGTAEADRVLDAMQAELGDRIVEAAPGVAAPAPSRQRERHSQPVLAPALALAATAAALVVLAALWWPGRSPRDGDRHRAMAWWPRWPATNRPADHLEHRVVHRIVHRIGCHLDHHLLGPAAALGLAAATVLLGWSGLGVVADGLLIVACVALVVLVPRPVLAVTTVGWLWLVTPLAARLADWAGGTVDPRPLSLLPPLVALSVGCRWARVADLVRGPGRLVTTVGVVGLAAAVFGLVEGRWRGEGIGLALWLAPLAIAATLLSSRLNLSGLDRSGPDQGGREGPGRLTRRQDPVDEVLGWLFAAASVAAVLAIVQWLVLPPWDELWIRTAVINSVGDPAARSFRPFGPVNAPAVLGVLLGTGLVVGVVRRARLVPVAAIVVALILSEQRTAWVAVGVAFVALVVRVPELRRSLGRTTLVILALSVAAFTISGGARAKLQRTLTETTSDVSVAARLETYGDVVGRKLWTLTGSGLGSVGVAATAEDESAVSIDGVIPRDVHRLGGLLTAVHVAALVALAARGAASASTGRAPAAIWGVVVLALVAGLGTNTVAGAIGIVTWTALGAVFLQADQAGRIGGFDGAT